MSEPGTIEITEEQLHAALTELKERELEMEKRSCFMKYGERGTELEIATKIALEFSKGIISPLGKCWVNQHNILAEQERIRKAMIKVDDQLKKELNIYAEKRRPELEEAYGLREMDSVRTRGESEANQHQQAV